VNSIEEERRKYTKESNTNDKVKRSHSLKQSAIESKENQPLRLNFPDKRTVCNLYLKVDPTLYQEIYNNEGNQVIYFLNSISLTGFTTKLNYNFYLKLLECGHNYNIFVIFHE